MSTRFVVGLLLCLLVSLGHACQLRVTAASTDLSYPSSVETVATVLVSLRNDGTSDCVATQFDGPGLLLNVTGEPGGSAQPTGASAHPFRFESVTDFGGLGRCGGAGAQLTAQGLCTWSVLRPAQTVVMRAELRAPVHVPRPMCFGGVIFGDGQRGLFLVAQPVLASFSTCTASASRIVSTADAVTADRRMASMRERAQPIPAIR